MKQTVNKSFSFSFSTILIEFKSLNIIFRHSTYSQEKIQTSARIYTMISKTITITEALDSYLYQFGCILSDKQQDSYRNTANLHRGCRSMRFVEKKKEKT